MGSYKNGSLCVSLNDSYLQFNEMRKMNYLSEFSLFLYMLKEIRFLEFQLGTPSILKLTKSIHVPILKVAISFSIFKINLVLDHLFE